MAAITVAIVCLAMLLNEPTAAMKSSERDIMAAAFPTALSKSVVSARCFADSRAYWTAFRNGDSWALFSKCLVFC